MYLKARHINGGVGILPIVAAGATAGAAAGIAVGKSSYDDGWLGVLAQWLGIKATPSLPINPDMPALRAPVAPQTASAMHTWDMAQLAEAEAQRNRQYAADLAYQGRVVTGTIAPGDVTPDSADNLSYKWLLIGGAVIGGIVMLRK